MSASCIKDLKDAVLLYISIGQAASFSAEKRGDVRQ